VRRIAALALLLAAVAATGHAAPLTVRDARGQ
jgi:hypothetical protein